MDVRVACKFRSRCVSPLGSLEAIASARSGSAAFCRYMARSQIVLRAACSPPSQQRQKLRSRNSSSHIKLHVCGRDKKKSDKITSCSCSADRCPLMGVRWESAESCRARRRTQKFQSNWMRAQENWRGGKRRRIKTVNMLGS